MLQGGQSTTIRMGKYKLKFGKGVQPSSRIQYQLDSNACMEALLYHNSATMWHVLRGLSIDADEDVDSMSDGATRQICLLQQALYGPPPILHQCNPVAGLHVACVYCERGVSHDHSAGFWKGT